MEHTTQQTISLPAGGQLQLFAPPERPHGMVLICPGGAYKWLSPREEEPVARAFLAAGWGTAVLHYTIRTDAGQPPLGRLPLQQLGQAAAALRQRFPQQKLVVCGFSAGGHLAASLGTHGPALGLPRPDALVLCYPVVTAGPYANRESIANLAGEDEALWDWFSLEKHIHASVPPAFIWHTVADPEVPVQNSLLLAEAYCAAGVPYEMHLYPVGVHGLSLATPEVEEPAKRRFADPHIASWFGLCLEWLAGLDQTKE